MTKQIFAAAVAIGFVLSAGVQPAAAQSFGARGGVTFITVATNVSDGLGDVSAEPGLVAGGFLTFRDSARLSFEVAGQVAQRRVGFGPDITDTMTYLEVPVVVRYPVLRSGSTTVRAIGGGSVAFVLTAKESVFGDSFSIKDAVKPIDVALVVGAQADLGGKWLIEGRYQFGLSEVYEVTIGGFETRQRGFQILVGYRLR